MTSCRNIPAPRSAATRRTLAGLRGRRPATTLVALWLLSLGFIPGCSGAARGWLAEPLPAAEDSDDVETIFAAESSAFPGRSRAAPLKTRQLNVVIDVLHIEVPRSQRVATRPLWRQLQEDCLDARTALQLRRNGLRAGVGPREWWPALQGVFADIPGVRSHVHEPLRIPAGFPIALELEGSPRDHTIFAMCADGVLSGETWEASLPVLRLTQTPSAGVEPRARFTFVPEVRQNRASQRWVRTESGVAATPEARGRAYPEASFAVDLSRDEFLMIAPSESAEVYGILGGVLLSRSDGETTYDSFIFLRPDIRDVGERHP